jgi:nucleoside-diphosphate-sugar epimerase
VSDQLGEPMTSTLPDEAPPETEAELEERLSRPAPGTVEAVEGLSGDILILGAGGKMGPTLARMARRAMDASGRRGRVLAVARFSDPTAEDSLRNAGVETVRADLLDPDAVRNLPDAENVIFMAGLKFGTSGRPEMAWAMNTVAPVYVADRYREARMVVFSTGCVYPNVPVSSGGSRENDPLEPVGDYANSCVGRERIFSYFAHQNGTPLSIFRLNYAIDLRYGVLVDVATKVRDGIPVDVTMGYANVIWQGDANDRAIRCLAHAAVPPFILNVTGPETISIRDVARRFGALLGRQPIIVGREAPGALLSNGARSVDLFGPPAVPLPTMLEWVASWLSRGGRTLGKPTHFETFDGRY